MSTIFTFIGVISVKKMYGNGIVRSVIYTHFFVRFKAIQLKKLIYQKDETILISSSDIFHSMALRLQSASFIYI